MLFCFLPSCRCIHIPPICFVFQLSPQYALAQCSCEAEIWELLNALKEENDNLKLERTVDLTQPTQQTDEYGDPVSE